MTACNACLPRARIRDLDFPHAPVGPQATMLNADSGADVCGIPPEATAQRRLQDWPASVASRVRPGVREFLRPVAIQCPVE